MGLLHRWPPAILPLTNPPLVYTCVWTVCNESRKKKKRCPKATSLRLYNIQWIPTLTFGAGGWPVDADFLAGVVGAALQDELWTRPRRDDWSLLLQLALRTGARQLRNVICLLGITEWSGYMCTESSFMSNYVCYCRYLLYPHFALCFVWST